MRPLAAGLLAAWLLPAVLAAPAVAGPPADAARAEEWSLRLMQEKARIDHARMRLDEANAAYARAVAKGGGDLVIASFESRRQAAVSELRDAETALPRLLEQARREGVSEEILQPYRFAVRPADTP